MNSWLNIYIDMTYYVYMCLCVYVYIQIRVGLIFDKVLTSSFPILFMFTHYPLLQILRVSTDTHNIYFSYKKIKELGWFPISITRHFPLFLSKSLLFFASRVTTEPNNNNVQFMLHVNEKPPFCYTTIPEICITKVSWCVHHIHFRHTTQRHPSDVVHCSVKINMNMIRFYI